MRYAVVAHQGQYAIEEGGRRVAVVTHWGVDGWKWQTRQGSGTTRMLHRALIAAYRMLRSGAPDKPCIAHDIAPHPPRNVPCTWEGITFSTKLGKEDGVP